MNKTTQKNKIFKIKRTDKDLLSDRSKNVRRTIDKEYYSQHPQFEVPSQANVKRTPSRARTHEKLPGVTRHTSTISIYGRWPCMNLD